jgi:hypothetical protein
MFEHLNYDALKRRANVRVSERVAAALASRGARRGSTGGRRRVEEQLIHYGYYNGSRLNIGTE